MKRLWFLLLLGLLLVGCANRPPTTIPTATPRMLPSVPTVAPTELVSPPPEPTEEPVPTPALDETTAPEPVGDPGLPLPVEKGSHFSTSGACAACHTRLTDQAGNDVSIDNFWRSTMMANAARDPYWLATVRTEVIKNPDYREIIEDKCATCHTPMAHFSLSTTAEVGSLLDTGLLDSQNPLHGLAIDGVSCTVCHQIEATNLGQPESFSGHYEIDATTPAGERVNYGPFPVTEANANIMKLSSGFTPVQSQHLRQAQLCATCHTLYTPFLDATDQVAGEFPEQTPYLEWLYSDYRGSISCQGCHMPAAQGGVVLSVTGGEPQQPFSQHNFVGGNAFMLTVLRSFPQELQVTASTDHFDSTITRVQEQLQNRTATLAVEDAQVDGDLLTLELALSSQVGHKFPGGFPSRRAWLHVTVTDANGALLFESGAVDERGRIDGNDNDDDAALAEPHYELITSPDQVQIYEAIMHDSEGKVTTTLLRGAGYLKDNRLLPAGFVKENHLEDVAVRGAALVDPDFVGGGDRVRYLISVGASPGPFTIQAELLYQTVAYRWAQNLASYESAEVDDFLRYYDATPNTPLQVAAAVATVE